MRPALLLTTLALLAIALAGCSGSDTSNTAPGDNQSVSIKDFNFNPSTVNLNKGSTLQWTNDGQQKHSVTIHSPAGTEVKTQDLTNGQKTTYTFNDAGNFHVVCRFHSSMEMSITVK